MQALVTSVMSFGSFAAGGVQYLFSSAQNSMQRMNTSQKVAIVGAVAVLGIALMAATQTGSLIEHIKTPATQYWPFSDAVLVRGFNVDTLRLSGKMGTVGPSIISGGIVAETKQMMQNIDSTLRNAGYTMQNVIECKLMIVDIEHNWKIVSDEYAKFFGDGVFPARSAYGVSGLALGGLVEGTCVAAKTTTAFQKMQYVLIALKSLVSG